MSTDDAPGGRRATCKHQVALGQCRVCELEAELAVVRDDLREAEAEVKHQKSLVQTYLDAALRGRTVPDDLFRRVQQFHRAFDVERHDAPTVCNGDTHLLRYKLIMEELEELGRAYVKGDLAEIADALGDLLYVVVGAFVTHGLDMQGIFNEVHRSNMTKVGGYKRGDGKWMKPATYSPPALARFCIPAPAPATEDKKS